MLNAPRSLPLSSKNPVRNFYPGAYRGGGVTDTSQRRSRPKTRRLLDGSHHDDNPRTGIVPRSSGRNRRPFGEGRRRIRHVTWFAIAQGLFSDHYAYIISKARKSERRS